ncbi:MAG: class I SAM-dependent methyltransferase [Gammaproteobacteria bacterium]|nr:class I SAM-dependent methyltransferase [Gammaproteobacteria bacterium]
MPSKNKDKNKQKNKQKKDKQNKATMAEKADRHDLYEQSVQCVEAEIDFVDEIFTKLRDRTAKYLREDFCGTGNTSCEWARRRKTNHAVGIDLDEEVVDWGRKNKIGKLKPEQAKRVELRIEDVMQADTSPMDIVLAMNFSYWLFEDRPTMIQYFKRVRGALADDGIFFLDAFGGYDAPRVLKERTKFKKHTYIWEQAYFNPINNHMRCHIHFKMKDGSKLEKAFTYEWRLWSLPEIRELLLDAGFSKATVYWQGSDEDGDGDGEFFPTEEGEADAGWIAYIVAEK